MTIIAGDYSGKTYFTVIPDKPNHTLLSLPHLLIKDTPETIRAQLMDVWGNAIDLQDWSMNVESSTTISLLPLASQINHSFTGKAVDSLTLTPLEAGNTTLTVSFSRDETKIVSMISRPVLSDAHLVVDIPNKNLVEV